MPPYKYQPGDEIPEKEKQTLTADPEFPDDIYEDPFKTQVGGSHYKEYVIQPYEFFFLNKIPHHKAAIIRRILRYDHPTGKGLEDLNKIRHELNLIEKLEREKLDVAAIKEDPRIKNLNW